MAGNCNIFIYCLFLLIYYEISILYMFTLEDLCYNFTTLLYISSAAFIILFALASDSIIDMIRVAIAVLLWYVLGGGECFVKKKMN